MDSECDVLESDELESDEPEFNEDHISLGNVSRVMQISHGLRRKASWREGLTKSA